MLSSPTRPPSQSPLAATPAIVTSPAAAGGHSGAERVLQSTTPDAPREQQWGANLQAAVRQQVAIALLRLHSLHPAEFVRYVETLVHRCSLQMLVDTLHALTGCCAEPGLSALALSLGARTLMLLCAGHSDMHSQCCLQTVAAPRGLANSEVSRTLPNRFIQAPREALSVDFDFKSRSLLYTHTSI